MKTGPCRIAKLAALSLALAAHGAIALTLAAPEPVLTEGAASGSEVALGNAFADMSAGTLSAAAPAEALPAEATAALAPEAPPEALTPTAITPEAAPLVAAAPQPRAEPPRKTAPARKETPKRKAPAKAAPAASAAPAAPGNGAQNARAGEAGGRAGSQSRRSGNGGRAQQAGNAAVSNYDGLVMRHLARAGRPRVNVQGKARISFSIAASGQLTSASVARSSGSAALDNAALRVVRSASPFPPPPAGARRTFSVNIDSQ